MNGKDGIISNIIAHVKLSLLGCADVVSTWGRSVPPDSPLAPFSTETIKFAKQHGFRWQYEDRDGESINLVKRYSDKLCFIVTEVTLEDSTAVQLRVTCIAPFLEAREARGNAKVLGQYRASEHSTSFVIGLRSAKDWAEHCKLNDERPSEDHSAIEQGLLRLLESKDPATREAALIGLRSHGGSDSVRLLEEIANNQTDPLSSTAKKTLEFLNRQSK